MKIFRIVIPIRNFGYCAIVWRGLCRKQSLTLGHLSVIQFEVTQQFKECKRLNEDETEVGSKHPFNGIKLFVNFRKKRSEKKINDGFKKKLMDEFRVIFLAGESENRFKRSAVNKIRLK